MRALGRWTPGVLFLLAMTSPAAADWLVTKDGARIETEGPWKTKGAMVVFTSAKGTLSSLRLDEIDLERPPRPRHSPRRRCLPSLDRGRRSWS